LSQIKKKSYLRCFERVFRVVDGDLFAIYFYVGLNY